MSDSKKLRKQQGNILLTLSFIFFTLAVCSIWIIFIIPNGFFIMIGGSFSLLLFVTSFCFAEISCKTYIGVSENEICNSASAKMRKTTGIFELVKAFIFLALTISCLWAVFVFYKISTSSLLFILPFLLCFSGFMIHSSESCDNFMRIEKLIKKTN
ncbi:MAG: hypothetical protein HFJ41_07000 [Clostridia bacterium]|nr:hypothetical protein [Clostridia bacterium]